jgi:periplasmic protein TonB
MFGTLLASGAPRQPMTRPAMAAGILHVIVVIGALRLTAATPSPHPVAPRDTIPFQLALPQDPIPSRADNAPSPLAPAPLPPMEPSPPPPVQLASPYGLTDWEGLLRSNDVAPSPGLPSHSDSVAPRFSTAEVDELPRLSGTLIPLYPEGLRRAGISGSVQLAYVILPSGLVDSTSFRVIASTEPAFTISVISALRGASFKPARHRGRPVAVLVQQTVRFQNR